MRSIEAKGRDAADVSRSCVRQHDGAAQPAPQARGRGPANRARAAAVVLAAGAGGAACGGGGGSNDGDPSSPTAAKLESEDASRFLSQASLGGTRAEIDRVVSIGIDAWLDEQFAMAPSTSHVQWLREQGYESEASKTTRQPLDYTIWRKLISSPDTLRQRVVVALSQIFVVAVEGVPGNFAAFATGRYLDILETHAFGNYRALLDDVTLSTAMGRYLSMLGSRKADSSGRRPDENYAREILQLFSIGLVQLNNDGSVRLEAGVPAPTYGEADVSGLARVFTGWDYAQAQTTASAARQLTPMANNASRHETGEKTFLGTTIPADTSGVDSLRIALDTIAAHPNVGPFIGRQLIQRLVTSNPSPTYVARVAAAFADNGQGVRGDLRATVRAVLTDEEARDRSKATASTTTGKLREPVLRFVQWARVAKVNSASGLWKIGNLSDPAGRLGQSPMHSPSVFNFYRPGYVPPNTAVASQGLVAPEFQITTETSVAGYLNAMQTVIATTTGVFGSDALPNYGDWLPLAGEPAALVAQANLVFAAGRVPASVTTPIADAITTMPSATDADLTKRVQAAMLLTMAAPAYLIER